MPQKVTFSCLVKKYQTFVLFLKCHKKTYFPQNQISLSFGNELLVYVGHILQ